MPVRWPAQKPESEADVLAGVLGLGLLNVALWRNTRGQWRDRYGHWISYGLGPNGASDIIGYRTIRIRPEMVGVRFAQFCSIETKRPKAGLRADQQAWIDNLTAAGALAGVAHSVEEAARLLGVM